MYVLFDLNYSKFNNDYDSYIILIKLVYTGSGNFIRGIPVDEWQTCIFSNFDKKSLKVTISFTSEFLF